MPIDTDAKTMSSAPAAYDQTVSSSESIAGLAKGLAIIEAFGFHSFLTVADAARHATTSRAAARRCLLTLKALGYVQLVGTRYEPCLKLRRLGASRSARDALAEFAHEHLNAARDRLGESVSLAVLDGGQSLFIARADAEHIVAVGVKVGGHLPAYCSATGRVLLADHTKKEILNRIGPAPFPRRTARTRVGQAEILQSIYDTQASGYSSNDEELEIGMRSLAVPVRGANGKTIAAISVSTASSRARPLEFKRKCLPILLATANIIEEQVKALGGGLASSM